MNPRLYVRSLAVRPAGHDRWLWAAGLTLVSLALTLGAGTAQACSCAPPVPVTEELNRSLLVFEGTARGPKLTIPGVVDQGVSFTPVGQLFEVKRRWKGDVGGTITVMTAGRDSACGQSYQPDVSYVLYLLRQDQGYFWDTSCSRSRPSSGAAEDLATLGEGLPPVAGSTDAGATDAAGADAGSSGDSGGCSAASSTRPPAGAGALLLGAGLAGALLRSRRRR